MTKGDRAALLEASSGDARCSTPRRCVDETQSSSEDLDRGGRQHEEIGHIYAAVTRT